MNAEEDKAARQERGPQEVVARPLGVSRITTVRRETGVLPVSREAGLAIRAIWKKRKCKKEPIHKLKQSADVSAALGQPSQDERTPPSCLFAA